MNTAQAKAAFNRIVQDAFDNDPLYRQAVRAMMPQSKNPPATPQAWLDASKAEMLAMSASAFEQLMAEYMHMARTGQDAGPIPPEILAKLQ